MDITFTEMGISILSGAITTFGSGMFLFGGVVTFFFKFAVIITSTIVISMACACMFFAALNYTIGPENDCGNVLAFFRKVKNFRNKNNNK